MIPRAIQWQGHYGAAHRKNLDTPPLTGCCLGTKVPYSEPAETTALSKLVVPCKEPHLRGTDAH
jgi:hypothetical protein